MSSKQEGINKLSNILSDVMNDIGVNEEMVKSRRSAFILQETLNTIAPQFNKLSYFYFGSQSEGSTTLGLGSDTDGVVRLNEIPVIHNISEHTSVSNIFLVIQNDNIPPGYCHLQFIPTADCLDQLVSLGGLAIVLKHCDIDRDGRLLLRNTLCTYYMNDMEPRYKGTQLRMHGPALTQISEQGCVDNVYGFYGESLPQQVISWIQKRKKCGWPAEEVLDKCRKSGCFLVPVASKLSNTPELEWRISTHLQERYLMFSLNITQIRCYILLKIILKSYVKPLFDDVLSSYMCKHVLLNCVSESSQDWHTGSLLSKLKSCLFRLQKCVEYEKCPHFIVPENNLMAARIPKTQRIPLLKFLNYLLIDFTAIIRKIEIDNIGYRIERRSRSTAHSVFKESSELTRKCIIFSLISDVAVKQKCNIDIFLNNVIDNDLSTTIQLLTNKLEELRLIKQYSKTEIMQIFHHTDIRTIRTACRLLMPLVSSTLGSVLAVRNITSSKPLSDEAFRHLTEGKDSDVLSGRLKLVSVLYCAGDMKRTEEEIDNTLEHYRKNKPVLSMCGCDRFPHLYISFLGFCLSRITDCNEKTIKSNIALCVSYLHHEINCVPHELRVEILRTYIGKDKRNTTLNESRSIVVDSIPFLHYLQYKAYGRLHKPVEQRKSLQMLVDVSFHTPNLGHREVALNLLGQCCGKENMQAIALQCYIISLKHRKMTNVARLLLCLQLYKLLKQNK